MKEFFKIAAIFDWGVALILIVKPNFLFEMLQLPPPSYPGLLLMLGCVVLTFGWNFWQVAHHPSNRQLFQSAILAKIAGFGGLTLAVLLHEFPFRVFFVALAGDGLWIIPFVYFYKKSMKIVARHA